MAYFSARHISYTRIYSGLLLFCAVFVLIGYIYTTLVQQDLKLLQKHRPTGSTELGTSTQERSRNLTTTHQSEEDDESLPHCEFPVRRPSQENIEYRSEGNYWQSQRYIPTEDVDERVYGMHAYYDDRPILNNTVYIRLFVVATRASQHLMAKSSYCHLWTNTSDVPLIIPASSRQINGRRIVMVKGKAFLNHILSCKIPQTVIRNRLTISHVSFVPQACLNATVYFPVTYPTKPAQWDHVFGMCESNGISFGYFGSDQVLWLIEWFEANRLFGITEFNIYNGTLQLSMEVQKVFDYYQELGILLLHQQPPPVSGYTAEDVHVADIAMRTALNDCLYRNMYRYQYAVTIDLDELIVPYIHDNYTDMITSRLRTATKATYFTFPALALFKTFTGEVDEKQDSEYPLHTSSYVNAVGDRSRPKTFFDPRTCLGAFSHYCFTPLLKNAKKMGFTGGKLAKVHHYRSTCIKYPGQYTAEYCAELKNATKYMGRMLVFQDKLVIKLTHVAKHLGLDYLINPNKF